MQKSELVLLMPTLQEGVRFYVELLEFILEDEQQQNDVAQIIDSDGMPLLLAGPNAGDVTPYLTISHEIVKPGDTLTFPNTNLDTLYARLHKEQENIEIIEKRWGDRLLEVYDPGGYMLRFYVEAHRSEQDRLELYLSVIEELEEAVGNLSEAELELSLNPDSWSIRHIIHHIADAETLFVWWLKYALIESGRTYTQNWPTSNEVVATALQHEKKDIAPSLALIRATRMHIVQLVSSVPDAWERYTLDQNGNKTLFRDLIARLTQHALEHVDEIVAIRRANGL